MDGNPFPFTKRVRDWHFQLAGRELECTAKRKLWAGIKNSQAVKPVLPSPKTSYAGFKRAGKKEVGKLFLPRPFDPSHGRIHMTYLSIHHTKITRNIELDRSDC